MLELCDSQSQGRHRVAIKNVSVKKKKKRMFLFSEMEGRRMNPTHVGSRRGKRER